MMESRLLIPTRWTLALFSPPCWDFSALAIETGRERTC
jgi:hypothetical protein